MSYRPLADVRKDLRVEWYRCPVGGARSFGSFPGAAIYRAGTRLEVTWRCFS